MKRTTLLKSIVAGLLMVSVALPVFADEDGKSVTITGEGKCGKCALKETEKCQNVVQVEKDGKKTTYYLVDKADSKISKDFHSNLCQGSKKVTAAGDCKKVDGKLQVTVSKLELVKD